MNRMRKITGTQILGFIICVLICVVVIGTRRSTNEQEWIPRAGYDDATPLGGKGMRLLLTRLGYKVALQNRRLTSMPSDARAWLLLDPGAYFSRTEAKNLLEWVKQGGTLIWADDTESRRWRIDKTASTSTALAWLRGQLGIQGTDAGSNYPRSGQLLPDLVPLNSGGASVYWSGVKNASGSGATKTVRTGLEIAGSPGGMQVARIDYGTGHVLVVPDALLFTNYALSKADNAIFATNLVRAHVATGQGTVYFDERAQEDVASVAKAAPTLLYYLWRPPLRWAILQLLIAGLLLWARYGRRLGSPVPIPEGDPVTRASQFAIAMGTLFNKAGRPKAAGLIVGEEFRRTLARRLGMSTAEPDAIIAARAAQITGLPITMIDRLLLHSKVPREQEADILSDAQEMELVLRHINAHR